MGKRTEVVVFWKGREMGTLVALEVGERLEIQADQRASRTLLSARVRPSGPGKVELHLESLDP